MTFVTGSGDSHDVRLLDHATVVSGGETTATVLIDINGDENMDGGIDWLHLYFRDTRYTVTSTDCRVETQLTTTVDAGAASLPLQRTAGFAAVDGIWIERTGRNEEETTVIRVGTGALRASVSMGHPSGSFVTRKTKAWHGAQKLADIINTAGVSVAGRLGPDQNGVIHAQAWASGPSTGGITITFVVNAGATGRNGKLGNLDRVFVAHGRTLAGVPVNSGQGFQWTAGSGAAFLFANGDNNTQYHVTLDFTRTLLDKNGAVVPMAALETALYMAALKQKSRKVVALALRQLLRLLREYPREPFLAAVQEAARYGLYDLDRLERMILRRVARDYFLLEPDTDSHD
jgi:hypothetical protein